MMATTETNTTNKNDADNQVSHGFTNQNVWNQHPTTNQSSSSESASNLNETSMNISEMTMGGNNQNALEALASLASNAHTRLSIPSSSFNNNNYNSNNNNGTNNNASINTILDPPNSLQSNTCTTSTTTNNNNNDDDDMDLDMDTKAMPPPPPMQPRRLRSVSNPEGMEKWDTYSSTSSSSINNKNWRRHFVLPSCILEEELAEVTQACQRRKNSMDDVVVEHEVTMTDEHVEIQKQGLTVFGLSTNTYNNINNNNNNNHTHISIKTTNELDLYGTSPTTVISNISGTTTTTTTTPTITNQPIMKHKSKSKMNRTTKLKSSIHKPPIVSEEEEGEEIFTAFSSCPSLSTATNANANTTTAMTQEEEEATQELTPDELVQHARSRVLEDLSMEMSEYHKNGSGNGGNGGNGGVLPLPHSLEKYKEIYNKNGRIGIYTPAERAAIIAKFNSKRSRRVWNKKIRYNCRKNLADRRKRVKGRFVKRTDDTAAAAAGTGIANVKENPSSTATTATTTWNGPLASVQEEETPSSSPTPSICSSTAGTTKTTTTTVTTNTIIEEEEEPLDPPTNMDMPDIHDPEAGFRPTTSQPYRRLRRHTIT